MNNDENSAYDLYKPLRNYIKQFNLTESLGVIRAYLQNMQFKEPLPSDVFPDPFYLNAPNRMERHVYEWELEIIIKEIILNCVDSPSTKTLRDWKYFSGVVNKLKDLENKIAERYMDILKENILLEMYRLSHRQFPWQTLPNLSWMTNYYKIFSHPQIDSIIQRKMGLTTKEVYVIGLALTGLFKEKFILFYPPNIEIKGIDKKKFDKFIENLFDDFEVIKEKIKNCQSYNQDYVYRLNPLKVTPLIKRIHKGQEALLCPIPTYLFRRFTEGIYYEICKEKDFSLPFGESFENFIGEIIDKANTEDNYRVYKEEIYKIGKKQKHSTDWVVSDESANLFVECKTKKLRLGSKISLTNRQELEEDLEHMAEFIVQTYKSIDDYKNNHYNIFKNNNKKSYPLIVTLEDWYIFGDDLINDLDRKVIKKLTDIGLDPLILKNEPYSICSSYDFGLLMQVIQKTSIDKVTSKKTSGEYRLWAFQSFIYNLFNVEYKEAKDLFPDDYKEINPIL